MILVGGKTEMQEITGKYLGQVTQDFVKVSRFLQEASYQVRVRKISEYPIFILGKEKINQFGQEIIDKTKFDLDWFYNLSYLGELQTKNIIKDADLFVQHYKNADEFACLMVIDNENDFLGFVYVPFPED